MGNKDVDLRILKIIKSGLLKEVFIIVSRKESGRNEKGENDFKKSNINNAIDDTNYGSIFICDNNSSTSSL